MTEMNLERLNEFIGELEKKKIKYIVIAGFGLDGKRGYQSRLHQDLDVLCKKDDLPKIDKIREKLSYSGERFNDLYKLNRNDGSKVDVGLLTFEGDEAVSYGRIAITRFPKGLFEHPQKGQIGKIKFNIAPNELLKIWGSDSQKGDDADYVKSLPIDEDKFKRINRVLRKKQR